MMNDHFQALPRMISRSMHSRWQKKHAVPVKDAARDGNGYQHPVFDQFLEAVTLQMQPEGRALHTAGMFQHLRTLLPNDVTLADLVVGWQILAQPRHDTNSEVLHRRKTCAELATIAAQLTSDQGQLTSAVSVWQAWLDAFRGSIEPCQVAMVSTFEREVLELRSSLP